MLMRLFKRKYKRPDSIEFDRSQYCCEINHQIQWFDTKEEMLQSIENYSKSNTIYSLSMFRFDIYNLIR